MILHRLHAPFSQVNDSKVLFAVSSHSDAPGAGHVDIYDVQTKSWSNATLVSGGRTNMCGTVWKHLAIWAGGGPNRGQPKSRAVDAYDTLSGKWMRYNMSIGRDLLACATVANITVFAGGSAPQVHQSETAVVDIWDHTTDTWSIAKLSQARKKPNAVAAGTKIIIAGGEIAKKPPPGMLGGYTDVVDIFDTETGVWSTAKLSMPRQYFGAARATPELAVFGSDNLVLVLIEWEQC